MSFHAMKAICSPELFFNLGLKDYYRARRGKKKKQRCLDSDIVKLYSYFMDMK